ncbi:MAG: DNA-3-methyladenine glycosylase [Candidatus Saccharimonadales bacterium]
MDLLTAEVHLSQVDAVMAQLISHFGHCTIEPRTDYYAALVSSIISQQLSVKAAAAIWKRTLALFNGQQPTPAQLLNTPSETLRAVGMSNAKVNYVKDLAQHVADGRLDIAKVAQLDNQSIIKELVAVKGIGEWTAHMFLIFSLGRLDVLAWGDLGVRTAIRNLYDGDHLLTPVELQKFATTHKWPPFQSIACWYLWRSLDSSGEL